MCSFHPRCLHGRGCKPSCRAPWYDCKCCRLDCSACCSALYWAFSAQYQQEVGNHIGKPTLYFSFDGKYGSQGACRMFLCVSDSSSTHCGNILLQTHGLNTPHDVPTTSPTLAACSSQEAAAASSLQEPEESKQERDRKQTHKGLSMLRCTDIKCRSLASWP